MLSVACFCGHRGVAELLIRRGITVNTKNQVSSFILMNALKCRTLAKLYECILKLQVDWTVGGRSFSHHQTLQNW